MTDITAVVTPDEALTVAVSEGTFVLNTSTNLANPAVVESISNIADVDATTKINGSVLVYKTTTNRWTSTTILDAQDVTGGQY
jgi:fumarate hydratase class II